MRAQGLGLAVAVAVASVGVSAEAAIIPYNFQKVAETGANFSSIGVPTMNDFGMLAFQGVSPASGRGVYLGTPALVSRLATGNLTVTRSPYPSDVVGINNVGQVVFTALPPTDPGGLTGIDGVYRYNQGGAITTIAEPWSQMLQVSGGPVIDDNGRTAFTTWSGSLKNQVVGDGTGAPTATPLAASGTTPDIHVSNDGHTVATAVTGPLAQGNRIYRDGTVIVSDTSPTFADPSFPGGVLRPFRVFRADTGDGGRVAFSADWGSGLANGIYLWQDGALSKMPGSNDIGINAIPAINDQGTVAALIDATQDRLSIFKGGVEQTVVSVGDAFDGSTITALKFLAEGFNDVEQFAFNATLADGRSVNVLASPVTPVPEPGAIGAMVVVGGAAMARRRRVR